MIEIKNVSKKFYARKVLDNVSLNIPQGEVVGLLGPNGAGKTTLLKLIAGILNPDSGRIQPIDNAWPQIGYKPERLLFPNYLRVTQYLEIVADLGRVAKVDIAKVVFESLGHVGLLAVANKKIKDCSKGMRQRLALAQVLVGNPPFLLLDEPSNGLDPEGQLDIYHIIQQLHASGKTVLLSSHQLPEITQVCTQLAIMNHGRIHYHNSMSEALAVRTHTIIESNKDLAPISDYLKALHSDIQVNSHSLILKNEAMGLRRQILMTLLNANYDVVHVERKRITLAEIYSEVIKDAPNSRSQ